MKVGKGVGWLAGHTLECCLECNNKYSVVFVLVLDAVCFRIKPLVGTVRFLSANVVVGRTVDDENCFSRQKVNVEHCSVEGRNE